MCITLAHLLQELFSIIEYLSLLGKMYGGTELSPALVDRVTELAPVVSARIGQHLYVDRVTRASVGRIACVTNSGVILCNSDKDGRQ